MRKMIRPSLAVSCALAAALLAAVSDVQAQWSYNQPWNFQRDAHESRVVSCASPQPFNQKAFDDFYVDPNDVEKNVSSVTIGALCWWGVLALDPNQVDPNSPLSFVITFANHDPNACQPAGAIIKRCVTPSVRRVGTDCDDQPVYRFRARLPGGGFTALVGGRYWISIAEDDADSPLPGVDFWWSGHRLPKLCYALQFAPGGGITQPLVSVCDAKKNDLAFCLFARGVSGSFTTGGLVTVPAAATLEIRDEFTQELLETVHVEVYSDGTFDAFPTLPDGDYLAVLRIPGALPMQSTIMLMADSFVDIPSGLPLALGDLNGDDTIGFPDLAFILAHYGMSVP